jgi:hypothetical protein
MRIPGEVRESSSNVGGFVNLPGAASNRRAIPDPLMTNAESIAGI